MTEPTEAEVRDHHSDAPCRIYTSLGINEPSYGLPPWWRPRKRRWMLAEQSAERIANLNRLIEAAKRANPDTAIWTFDDTETHDG